MHLNDSGTTLSLPKKLTLLDIEQLDRCFLSLLGKGVFSVDASELESATLASLSMLKVWRIRAKEQKKCLNVLNLSKAMIDLAAEYRVNL